MTTLSARFKFARGDVAWTVWLWPERGKTTVLVRRGVGAGREFEVKRRVPMTATAARGFLPREARR